MTSPAVDHADKRSSLRVAGGGTVEAVVVDRYGRPVEVLRGAEVLNVSGGGLAMIAPSPVAPGSVFSITVIGPHGAGKDGRFTLETLDCTSLDAQRHKIRCKLLSGHVPAELMYGWWDR